MMLFLHDTLSYIHLKKDPVQIPFGLSRFGFKSYLVVQKKEKIRVKNVKVFTLNKGFSEAFRSKFVIEKMFFEILSTIIVSLKLVSLLKKIKPKVIISYFYPFLFPFLKFFSFLSGSKMKIICKLDWDGRVEGSNFKKISKKIGLFFVYIFSNKIIIESPGARERAIDFSRFLDSKLIVVPNGVPSEFVKLIPKKIKRKKVILCVASITRTKGIDLLLKAFSYLKNKHSEYQIRIVGPIIDEKYYDELIKMCYELGIEKNVVFLGKISDKKLAQEYGNAEIFCLPSFIEGFPLSRVEALNAGLPMVTTSTGGCEIIKDAGIIVDIGDVKGLAKALEKIMNDEKLRKEMSKNARKIGKDYTWEKVCENLINKIK